MSDQHSKPWRSIIGSAYGRLRSEAIFVTEVGLKRRGRRDRGYRVCA